MDEIERINRYLQSLVSVNVDAKMNVRYRMYTLLTLINKDIHPEVCSKIENILMLERNKEKIIEIPNHTNDKKILIFRGDITLLRVDAIVNAANADMLGCFDPGHKCIDNHIHAKAGPRLRMECRKLKTKFGKLTTDAVITDSYCLPCKQIIHVAGPIYDPNIDENAQDMELSKCYTSSLNLALMNGLQSIAFPCISTGMYGYPKKRAATVAMKTVQAWLNEYRMTVIFSVYNDEDQMIYGNLLHNFTY